MALDLADADLDGGTVSVAGKGHTEPVRVTLPGPTRAALAGWAASLGSEPGPLFVRLDRAARAPHPADRHGGLPDRPGPGPADAAARAAARGDHPGAGRDRGDVRTVQRFSRHADARTLVVDDDRRRDLAGDVVRLVAGE